MKLTETHTNTAKEISDGAYRPEAMSLSVATREDWKVKTFN